MSSSTINSSVNQAFTINIATMQNAMPNLDILCSQSNHESNLDDINIDYNDFLKLFYPNSAAFEINRQAVRNDPTLHQYVSLLPNYRTENGSPFVLLYTILANAETDLNLGRSVFTSTSTIQLTKQLSCIQSLADIDTTNIVNSIDLPTLQRTVADHYVANLPSTSSTSAASAASSSSSSSSSIPVSVRFVINIVMQYFSSGSARSLTLKPTNINLTYALNFQVPTSLTSKT